MTPSSFLWHSLSVTSLLALCISAGAQTAAKPTKKLKTLSYICRVIYEPSQALWMRELAVDYDASTFTAMRIDGVAVHGFAAEGALLTTHLDNERIFIDLQKSTWKSQFREQAQGAGACIKNKG